MFPAPGKHANRYWPLVPVVWVSSRFVYSTVAFARKPPAEDDTVPSILPAFASYCIKKSPLEMSLEAINPLGKCGNVPQFPEYVPPFCGNVSKYPISVTLAGVEMSSRRVPRVYHETAAMLPWMCGLCDEVVGAGL